jgi:hypothetical protein
MSKQIRPCHPAPCRSPSLAKEKKKGWRSEFQALGRWKFSRRLPPAASICGTGTQPTALRFQKLQQSPEHPHRAPRLITMMPFVTASTFCPRPGRDDDGLLASPCFQKRRDDAIHSAIREDRHGG